MRLLVLGMVLSVGCASHVSQPKMPATLDATLPPLSVREIAPSVLVHTSWKRLPEGLFSSNGLVVLGSHEALLVDTAWGEAPTEELLQRVERDHKRRVTHLVVTHSHEDRVGGIRVALRHGIAVHALVLTAQRTVAAGYPPPTDTFENELSLEVDGVRADVFFPGAAHSPDNVVVWLPQSGVLFGSCMVRAADASLGSLSDADLEAWPASLQAISTRFPSPRVVVPGHGEPGDASLLTHTAELLQPSGDK